MLWRILVGLDLLSGGFRVGRFADDGGFASMRVWGGVEERDVELGGREGEGVREPEEGSDFGC